MRVETIENGGKPADLYPYRRYSAQCSSEDNIIICTEYSCLWEASSSSEGQMFSEIYETQNSLLCLQEPIIN